MVTSLGGSLSGEHGDGQSRSELLPYMYTPKILEAFSRNSNASGIRLNKMNPGDKVQPAKKLDQDLRFGPAFQTKTIGNHVFSYHEEDSDFRRAALRCVGVGECRKHEAGTMCPSYRATQRGKTFHARPRAYVPGNAARQSRARRLEIGRRLKRHCTCACPARPAKKNAPSMSIWRRTNLNFTHHHYKGRRRPITHFVIGMIPTLGAAGDIRCQVYGVYRKLYRRIAENRLKRWQVFTPTAKCPNLPRAPFPQKL